MNSINAAPAIHTQRRITGMLRSLLLMLNLVPVAGMAQRGEARLEISRLRDDFYVYTTYTTYEGGRLPAHGLYVVTSEGVVLIDTPWDTTQFQPLLDSIASRHNRQVTHCIATHWHSDRTEGLEYYRQRGIRTYTSALTDLWSQKNHKKRAEFLMLQDTVFHVGDLVFETYYPGEGHTADNIVIWFPKQRVLYGGCLIKGSAAENLGYMGDANQAAYYTTLRNVQRRFRRPRHLVISHSDWDDMRALRHSIRLARGLRLTEGAKP